ncbi:hypothetical protein BN10_720005 [Phycicoccus elongatus Lp2]|uniref:Uncharacterized protein n=1 Tax=Phycicoccus elongatus Lp2 TaxID=1193181 RepID=N0E4S7_9MICO|nr:hypothetical protein BN10_720005 [Phycicoccus elongatus Lp2]
MPLDQAAVAFWILRGAFQRISMRLRPSGRVTGTHFIRRAAGPMGSVAFFIEASFQQVVHASFTHKHTRR